jgi:hypothetical protein
LFVRLSQDTIVHAMKICSPQILAALSLLTVGAISAKAQLTINANFTTSNTTDFPGSMPIADLPNASVVEATIDQAIAQVTSLISTPLTLNIDFLNDPNTALGASVGTGLTDLPYSTYLSYLQAELNKSAVNTTALASLPAGPGTGINNNATNVGLGGALLDAIGDTTVGNSLISSNGGFAGTVGLNMSILNTSRTNYDNTKYDLVSTVTHEVDEILGIGGEGSTLTATGGATNVGPMDLFRYSAPGVRSYSNSANVSSYFSINGGNTVLVHFNQKSGGDYGDWGDGVVPADGEGNNPPQVQDAFGDTTAEPNMGPNEAIALNAVGWQMSAAGLQLESVPEPSTYALLFAGALFIIGVRRRRAGSAVDL